MKVSEVMTKSPISAKTDDKVRKVVEKLIMRGCGAIPVIDDAGELVGIITIRDIMLPLYPNYGDYVHDGVHARDFEAMEDGYNKVLERKIGDLMTANPMYVDPSDPVLKAASYMGLKNLRRIPVVENNKLIGMISISDINRALFLSCV